jgi:hypothetical protein
MASASIAMGQTTAVPTEAELAEAELVLLAEPELGPVVVIGVNLREPDAPRLLPIEPELGPIIPISAQYEVDDVDGPHPIVPSVLPQAAPGTHRISSTNPIGLPMMEMLPIGAIAHPIPAPVGEPPFGALESVQGPDPIHPDQIQHTLSILVAQLNAAGLVEESRQVVDFQNQFQRQHAARLLIAFKEAQLAFLQEEINFLKHQQALTVRRPSVLLRFKFVQMNSLARVTLLQKMNARTELTAGEKFGSFVSNLDSQDATALLDQLCTQGDATILWEPSCLVDAGKRVSLSRHDRKESSVHQAAANNGFIDSTNPASKPLIWASPEVLDENTVELSLHGQLCTGEDFDDRVIAAKAEEQRYAALRFIQNYVRVCPRGHMRPERFGTKITVRTGQTITMIGNERSVEVPNGRSSFSQCSPVLMVTTEILENGQPARLTAAPIPSPPQETPSSETTGDR